MSYNTIDFLSYKILLIAEKNCLHNDLHLCGLMHGSVVVLKFFRK